MVRNKKSRLIVSLTGGLGNQLFQISNAISLNPEASLVLTKSFGRPRLNEFGEAEISSFSLPFPHEYTNHSDAPYVFRKVLGHTLKVAEHPIGIEKSNIYFLGLRLLSSIVVTIHYRKITVVRTIRDKFLTKRMKFCNYLMLGYFQFISREFEVLAKEVLSKVQILEKTAKLEREISSALSKNIMFVHVRLTDYLNEPAIGLLSSAYFNHAIQNYLRQTPLEEIWIFSDDHKMARDLLHVPQGVKVRYIPETEFSVAETFELLRCGTHYVLSNSTFGWWAAFLCHKESATVVMPRPWFRSLSYSESLHIKEWNCFEAVWTS